MKTIPSRCAEIGELRLLGDEPPPDPGGIRTRRNECSLERHMVEVAAALRRSSRMAGPSDAASSASTDEHRVPFAVGVEGDQPDRLVALLVEFTHGMDEAHRRLAAIDDRQP